MSKNNFLWTTTGICIGILVIMATFLEKQEISSPGGVIAVACAAWITMFVIANTTRRNIS